MRCEFLKIKNIQAPNFIMHPTELKEVIDFEIKRMYFITNPTGPTGSHCHKTEDELFMLVSGSCTAVIDRGQGIEEIQMNSPDDAVRVPAYVWHHFKNFSSDAILIALSSTNYDPTRSDYIEDYEEYLKIRDQKLSV